MPCKAVQKTGIRYNFLNTKQILRRKTPRSLYKGNGAFIDKIIKYFSRSSFYTFFPIRTGMDHFGRAFCSP